MVETRWGALGLGRRGITPPKYDLGESPFGPSLGSRMVEHERASRPAPGAIAPPPPAPGSPLAEAATDIASNFDFLGTFGGKRSMTADWGRLAKAQRFEGLGWKPETIWRRTGWFKGPDDQWRYEIDDSMAAAIGQGGEARAVQTRRNYTPEQRRAKFPLADYDVPLSELIVRR